MRRRVRRGRCCVGLVDLDVRNGSRGRVRLDDVGGDDTAHRGGHTNADLGGRAGDRGAQPDGRSLEADGMTEPTDRTTGQPQPAQADVQEGSRDRRVELAAGTPGDLHTGILGRHGLLVAPGARHHVVRVGDGNDATRQADVRTRGVGWVALPVPAQVVFVGCPQPVAQPWLQRFQVGDGGCRVAGQDLPLGIAGPPVLVEDLRGHIELADIVQERRPLELLPIGGRQSHLLGDHHRVRPHSLRMPSGGPIVAVDCLDEVEHVLTVRYLIALLVCGQVIVDSSAQLCGRPPAKRLSISRRGFVGEHQREAQERREREEPAGQTVGGDQGCHP